MFSSFLWNLRPQTVASCTRSRWRAAAAEAKNSRVFRGSCRHFPSPQGAAERPATETRLWTTLACTSKPGTRKTNLFVPAKGDGSALCANAAPYGSVRRAMWGSVCSRRGTIFRNDHTKKMLCSCDFYRDRKYQRSKSRTSKFFQNT